MGPTDGIPFRRSRFARATIGRRALGQSTRKWKVRGPIPFLRGGETLENTVNNLRSHSRSLVVNADFQVGACLGMPCNGHASVLLTHAGNCLDGVTNEVENKLLQLATISVQRKIDTFA